MFVFTCLLSFSPITSWQTVFLVYIFTFILNHCHMRTTLVKSHLGVPCVDIYFIIWTSAHMNCHIMALTCEILQHMSVLCGNMDLICGTSWRFTREPILSVLCVVDINVLFSPTWRLNFELHELFEQTFLSYRFSMWHLSWTCNLRCHRGGVLLYYYVTTHCRNCLQKTKKLKL